MTALSISAFPSVRTVGAVLPSEALVPAADLRVLLPGEQMHLGLAAGGEEVEDDGDQERRHARARAERLHERFEFVADHVGRLRRLLGRGSEQRLGVHAGQPRLRGPGIENGFVRGFDVCHFFFL